MLAKHEQVVRPDWRHYAAIALGVVLTAKACAGILGGGSDAESVAPTTTEAVTEGTFRADGGSWPIECRGTKVVTVILRALLLAKLISMILQQ